MTAILEIKDLVTNFYTYEGVVKALNKISLDIEKGVTFGLVGESGCGKSVAVRSIMRIIQSPGVVESGQVIFHSNGDSTDLLKLSEESMRDLRGNQISMIFQEPNSALNPILTIGEQVSESFLFHQKKDLCAKVLEDLNSPDCKTLAFWKPYISWVYQIAARNDRAFILKLLDRIPLFKWDRRAKKEALIRSIDIIEKLHVPDAENVAKNSYPHNLSGGLKQRIVIAIALACNPELLISDEATSNLDVTIQAQILELFKELKREIISSIILITHDLGVVAETCERVGVMYAGNLCEVADVEEIFNNPKHPYTKVLLDSVPKISQEGKLLSIDGNVPNLVTPPPGCRFHPRCKDAMDVCSRELPETIEIEKDHLVACHLYLNK